MLKRLLLAVAVSWVASRAAADVLIVATQQGNDVVFEGAGSLEITGLTESGLNFILGGGIIPSISLVAASNQPPSFVDGYAVTLVGDANFGPGSPTAASSHSGDAFGFNITPISGHSLFVPVGYVSGAAFESHHF